MNTIMTNTSQVMTTETKKQLPVISREYVRTYDVFSGLDFDSEQPIHTFNVPDISCKTKGDFTILKYNHGKITPENRDLYGKFKSVVFHKNKLVAFSPPKNITLSTTNPKNANDFNELVNNSAQFQLVEDFVEGTMINLFYCHDESHKNGGFWEIATRGVPGADTSFYNDTITYRKMFFEAVEYTHLNFDNLDYRYSYSFVLRHPKNRNVGPTPVPMLFLCAAYYIQENVVHEIDIHNDEEIQTMFRNSAIGTPYQYTTEIGDVKKNQTHLTYEEKDNAYPSSYSLHDLVNFTKTIHEYYQGIVFRFGDKTYKIRNEKHSYIKQLQGNQPNFQFQYLSLRKSGRLPELLAYFPDYKDLCTQYNDEINTFTTNLYEFYVKRHITKEYSNMKELPFEYRPHVYQLHKQYLNSFRTKVQKINIFIVQQYISQLPPAKLMFALNYNKRHNPSDNTVNTTVQTS